MKYRRSTLAVAGVVAAMGVAAGPAAGEPNENASCVAEFGAAVRANQGEGENFGQFVSAAAKGEGIHGGESARRKCGENG